eukprot:EG_transcript_13781
MATPFPSASPSISPSVSASASPMSPSASPSASPSPSIEPLLAALRDRTATTVLSLTAADLALLAAEAPATTLVGPTCNTSVVAAVTQCTQSVPASISLATMGTPAEHVQCWGNGVQAAIVSQCTPSVASIRALGLTPPANFVSNTVLQVLIVDRSDAAGNLQNGQPVSLLLLGPSPTGRVAVVVYSGGDTVGVDLTSIGGSITSVPGGYLLTSPHSSTFAAFAAPATTPAAPAPATPAASGDNGWWIALAAGLGAGIPVLLIVVAAIGYGAYLYYNGETTPAFAQYATPAQHWTSTPTAVYPVSFYPLPPAAAH